MELRKFLERMIHFFANFYRICYVFQKTARILARRTKKKTVKLNSMILKVILSLTVAYLAFLVHWELQFIKFTESIDTILDLSFVCRTELSSFTWNIHRLSKKRLNYCQVSPPTYPCVEKPTQDKSNKLSVEKISSLYYTDIFFEDDDLKVSLPTFEKHLFLPTTEQNFSPSPNPASPNCLESKLLVVTL